MADIEQLRADLARNSAPEAMRHLDVMTRGFFTDTVWPFFDSLVDTMEEQESALQECIEQTEDLLHAETAQEIGKPIGIGLMLCTELERSFMAPPSQGSIARMRALIAEYRSAAQIALGTLQDIAIPDDEDEEPTGPTRPIGAPANGNADGDDADDDGDGDGDDEIDEEEGSDNV